MSTSTWHRATSAPTEWSLDVALVVVSRVANRSVRALAAFVNPVPFRTASTRIVHPVVLAITLQHLALPTARNAHSGSLHGMAPLTVAAIARNIRTSLKASACVTRDISGMAGAADCVRWEEWLIQRASNASAARGAAGSRDVVNLVRLERTAEATTARNVRRALIVVLRRRGVASIAPRVRRAWNGDLRNVLPNVDMDGSGI
ncbi:hypothetical protein BWQ96_06012 [Gracilariopsis chorda]|uniref:Uncharacterized protein n=1 Tax=Gracilariopsis chorda TaxID=448386 RepID=A0A2V3IQ62_9FLOR|nr:hypothetical protein BWQ96_06012 [Gracilariopsis chorda]|eukprot:PXF44231.1 hypothetical protein BWQ96_06012 [Gracilariopsis chorda]